MIRSVDADPQYGAARVPPRGLGWPGGSAPGDGGVRVEEFVDRDAWLAAVDAVRRAFESES